MTFLQQLNFCPSESSGRSLQQAHHDSVEQAVQMKCDLLAAIDRIGGRLPANTLDELIDSFGGPDNVSEVCSMYSLITPKKF